MKRCSINHCSGIIYALCGPYIRIKGGQFPLLRCLRKYLKILPETDRNTAKPYTCALHVIRQQFNAMRK